MDFCSRDELICGNGNEPPGSASCPQYESFTSTDCETLIRRMLVVDPAKRITIAQIRQHRWMQADPTLLQQDDPTYSMQGYTSNLGDYNEQVLGIMQALGIDRQRTVEVSTLPCPRLPPWNGGRISLSPSLGIGLGMISQGSYWPVQPEPHADPSVLAPQSLQNSSYNHFAAIYYLLLERLKEHRSTQPSSRPSPAPTRQPRLRSSDLSSLEVRMTSFSEPCPCPFALSCQSLESLA